jgi:hypothetical protein
MGPYTQRTLWQTEDFPVQDAAGLRESSSSSNEVMSIISTSLSPPTSLSYGAEIEDEYDFDDMMLDDFIDIFAGEHGLLCLGEDVQTTMTA